MYFRDVQHQDRALRLLQGPLRTGRIPHAWLLAGPQGVGKELSANALAARLLCLTGTPADIEPCGTCASCRLVQAGNHPDFQLVERGLRKFHPDRSVRTSKGLFLAVDLIRHFVIEPAAKMPQVSQRRVYIIRDADRMNEQAQNALLKTLEEPPADACLILVSASAERLLPTIRSRSTLIPFAYLPGAFVCEELKRRARLADPDAETLAALAEGQLGLALQWNRAGLLRHMNAIYGAMQESGVERFAKQLLAIAEELGSALTGEDDEPDQDDDGADLEEGASKTRSKSKAPPTDVLRDAIRLVLRVVAHLQRGALMQANLDVLAHAIRAVQRTEEMLERNVSPQLALESLAASM